jgi:hypothetical protein
LAQSTDFRYWGCAASGFSFYALFLPRRPPPKIISQRRRTHSHSKHQAPTQAPSTKQSNSKPVAAQRQAAWLGLAACFWLILVCGFFMASGFCLAGRQISGPAAQSMAMAMGDHPSSLQARGAEQVVELARRTRSRSPCTPFVRARRPLYTPPAKSHIFWACGAYYYNRPGHHWPRTAKWGSISGAHNGLPYASSDQLARNPVQHTHLLAFPANAQSFLSLRRQGNSQYAILGLCGRRGGG